MDSGQTLEESTETPHRIATKSLRPPLWSPGEEAEFRSASLATPPSLVEGWNPTSRVLAWLLASPRRAVTRIGMAIGIGFMIVALPTLADYSNWGNLTRVAFYHGWTLLLLALVGTAVRTVSIRRIAAFALLGSSVGALLVYYLAGPLIDVIGSETPTVWVTPPLEEVVKVLLVVTAVVGASRRLDHPGLFDLALLGYAIGAGFAFQEDALWGRATTSGFRPPWGALVPSIYQSGDVFALGHAGWTTLAAMGAGLLILHWRKPVATVGGVAVILVVILDHMSINDRSGSLDWVVDVLFDHRLTAWLLVGGLAVALATDLRLLAGMRRRDHLLGGDVRPDRVVDPQHRALALVAGLRFRRGRNAVWFARHTDRSLWPTPPRPATTAVLVRQGRLARVAGRSGVGSGAGWDLDPADAARARWYDEGGWTPFVVGTDGMGVDDAPGRPELRPIVSDDPPENWARVVGWLAGLLAAAVILRVLTAPDQAVGGVDFGLRPGGRARPFTGAGTGVSLPGAPHGPGGGMFGAGFGAGASGWGGSPSAGADDHDPPPLPPGTFDGIGSGPGSPPADSPPQPSDSDDDC